MALALLFHYSMLNMFRMLIHPFSGACDLFVELFHGYGRPTLRDPCVRITRLITSETSTRGLSRWWTIYFFFKRNGSI